MSSSASSPKLTLENFVTQLREAARNWIGAQGLDDFSIIQGFQRAMQLGAVIAAVFIFADRALLGNDRITDFLYCLTLRVMMFSSCAAYVWWTHKFFDEGRDDHLNDSNAKKFHALIGLFVAQFIGYGTSAISIIIDGSQSNYFAGLIMVFVGLAILVPISPSLFALNVALMTAVYGGCLIWDEWTFKLSTQAISNTLMVISGATVSWFCCAAISKSRGSKSTDSREGTTKERDVIASTANALKPSGTSRAMSQNFLNLAKVAGMIFLPIFGLMTKQSDHRVLADSHISLGAINLVGLHDYDQSIEFRNTCRFPISIDGAQVLIRIDGEDSILDVASAKLNKIMPGKKFRVYTGTESNGQHMLSSATGIDWEKANVKGIRLFGFKINKGSG